VEKKQYDLFLEILRRLKKAGILKSVVLIGSWCIPFYKEYFEELKNISPIRTRDIDFLVLLDAKFKKRANVIELLEDLGFKYEFLGEKGYIRLLHPLLMLEFLVPEFGRESDKPYKLPELGINAQRIRFLGMLADVTIKVDIGGIDVVMPHPVSFALQKLLAGKRRSGAKRKEKEAKDKLVSLQILGAIIEAGEIAPVKGIFKSMHKNRQRDVIKVLKEEGAVEVLHVLSDKV
jgi:hypothetical protein